MAAARTYTVTVDGVGDFVCQRRTMRVALAISAEYNRLTGGAETVASEFSATCSVVAFLSAVVTDAPAGWDLFLLDPDSPEDMDGILKVYTAVKAEEGRFLGRADAEPKAEGEGA